MTNLDEKKPREFWIYPFKPTKMLFTYLKPNELKKSAPENFDEIHVIEYSAFADQQKKIEKLEKAVELMRTQVLGLILCLKTHGTNINDLFLIDHYKKTLAKVDSILKEGE